MSTLKEKFDKLVSGFKSNSKQLQELDVALKAEDEKVELELDADGNPIVEVEVAKEVPAEVEEIKAEEVIEVPEEVSVGDAFVAEVGEMGEGEYSYQVSVDAEGVVTFNKVVEPSQEELDRIKEEADTMLASEVKLADEARMSEIKLAKQEVSEEYEELLVTLRSEFSKPFVDAPEVKTVKVPLTVAEAKLAAIQLKRKG